MRAAQFVGVKRDAVVKVAVLSGAGMLGLALATPARADDQTAPPPLMVAKTAVIAPDEPDATASTDAGAAPIASPAPAPAPDPAPARVVAPSGWELAGKARVVHRPPPVRVETHVAETAPPPVISAPVRPVHAARPHHTVKRAHPAEARVRPLWYQLSQVQYRHARADGRSGPTQAAAATAPEPSRGVALPPPAQPQRARAICELRIGRCLQICSWNAMHNGPRNGRWIGACISSYDVVPRLDRVHELLLQRLWSIALDARTTASGRQYQCFGTQYQTGTCATARSPRPIRTLRAQPHRRGPLAPVQAAVRSVARVTFRHPARATTAVATHATRAATKTVDRRPHAAREVAPPVHAGATSTSSDWLLRTLVALVGVAMLALLLAALSELPAAGPAVTGMRTRLASKGLSSSRIDVGRDRAATPPRGEGIPYRD